MRPTERRPFPHRRGLIIVGTLATAYVASHFFRASNVTIGLDLMRDLAIGPAPRHPGLWLAFGNQHIGFTTGPATGAAIAAMIAGTPPTFDARAFSPGRYL